MSKEASNASNKKMATVKLADMPDDMQQDAQDITLAAIEKYTNERDIAYQIKREFERKYLGGWHCVVGKQYSSYVTHEEGYFIQMAKGPLQILLFRC